MEQGSGLHQLLLSGADARSRAMNKTLVFGQPLGSPGRTIATAPPRRASLLIGHSEFERSVITTVALRQLRFRNWSTEVKGPDLADPGQPVSDRPLAMGSTTWRARAASATPLLPQGAQESRKSDSMLAELGEMRVDMTDPGDAVMRWNWILLSRGVVVMDNPMAIETNLQLASDSTVTGFGTIHVLNHIIYALPWQPVVLDAIAASTSETPAAPGVHRAQSPMAEPHPHPGRCRVIT